MRRRRSRLYGPDDKPLEPPTSLGEWIGEQAQDDRLLPVVEALNQRNSALQDVPWQAKVSPILDARGRPYLRVVK